MERVWPEAFLVAHTAMNPEGLAQFANYYGIPHTFSSDGDGGEKLIEYAGRMCYRSFDVSMNPNLTRVREGNKQYIENILKQKHGSVLEHATATFMICDVSRVFTHELVRHRAGTAFSQESLRYVRLDSLKGWFPDAFNRHEKKRALEQLFLSTFEYLEDIQLKLAKLLNLDDEGTDFAAKKMLTSAMRRLAPEGLATNICITANHRAWRHMIALRTEAAAEEEIRKVFWQIAEILFNHFPAIYQDMVVSPIEGSGIPAVTFKHGVY